MTRKSDKPTGQDVDGTEQTDPSVMDIDWLDFQYGVVLVTSAALLTDALAGSTFVGIGILLTISTVAATWQMYQEVR